MKSSIRPIILAILSMFLLLPAGCTWSFGNHESETNEMHRRFSRTVDIQTGVVLGDLSRARTAADWLANREETGTLQETSDSYRARIRGYASLIAQARDLDTVSRQVGQIAAACGDCHSSSGNGPRFVVGSGPPEAGARQAERMILHLWAADRMWEGLIGPSEEAWLSAVEALSRGWEPSGSVLMATASPDAISGYMGQLHRLAEDAREARTQEARSRVYGRLLNTCQGCHGSVEILAER